MDEKDEIALEIALRRNIHPENLDEALSMAQMAHYMMLAEGNLRGLPDATLDQGEATLVAVGAGENR